jgi:ubiquinone/menaquinone biosynthesis C-methylase UbiE
MRLIRELPLLKFKILCPDLFKGKARYSGKTILRIGGGLNWALYEWTKTAKEIIDVNISDYHIGQKNFVTLKSDAHHLPELQSESVDIAMSSHVIEHLTNPIKALKEWKRILKPDGLIYACIPHHKKTFDHRRAVTSLKHLIEDYENNVGLDDDTHTQEFLEKYDIKKDLVFKDLESWKKNYLSNPQIYTHFHVFNEALVRELMDYAGFKCISLFSQGVGIEYFGQKIG